MKYIDAEKLKNEIKRQADLYQDTFVDGMRDKLIDFIDACMPDIVSKKETTKDSLQQEQPEVDLENYISNKLRELGADLINHKPYSFNRGLNVGKTDAYHDILGRLSAIKEERQ